MSNYNSAAKGIAKHLILAVRAVKLFWCL